MKHSNRLNLRLVSLLLSLIIITLAANAALAARKNYNFVNYSGKTIKNLYVSLSSDGNWGSDHLGSSEVLINGKSLSCWYNDRYRYFDIKVVFMDNSDLIWYKYDFKGVWRLTLHVYDGKYGYALSNN